MEDMISKTNVGSVDLKDKARAHIGNVVHIHQTEDRCLSDLRNTDPRLDKARIEATKGGLLKDSYRWILEHSDFQQWRDDEQSRLLWIKGDPGKGKTMLLCGIVNELAPHTKLKDEKSNTLLSYCFCQAADERINSATAVLRGLIYLIVEQQPPLISHITKKYKYGGATIFKDVNAWFALSEIFSDILEDKRLEQAYVIIDALDECVNDLPKLLDFINTKSTISPRIKWIVSSRNWSDIEERLDSAAQQRKLCLELNEKSISTAVNAYISHQVDRLAQKRKYNAKTKHAVHHHLSSNSNDTFLWVALVCQNLEKISLQNTLLMLNEFPPGLDALYERMIEQIYHLEDIRDILFCCRMLATLMLVYRPVTLAELGCLIESPNDAVAVAESIREAIGLCGSFLTIRDNQVYLIHQSAKDYLSNNELSTFFFPSPADVHADIFSRSIQSMSVTLQRNIYNLQSPGVSRNEIKALDPDPLSAIRYSCVHWIDHFRHMRNSQSQDHDEKYQTAFQFLQKYFLYWLEALSLVGHIEDGVLSMARLEYLLSGKSSNNDVREMNQGSPWFYPSSLTLMQLLGNLHKSHGDLSGRTFR
ncbi:NACHT domain-containing protein [Trichoderma sp. SZMC 28012]